MYNLSSGRRLPHAGSFGYENQSNVKPDTSLANIALDKSAVPESDVAVLEVNDTVIAKAVTAASIDMQHEQNNVQIPVQKLNFHRDNYIFSDVDEVMSSIDQLYPFHGKWVIDANKFHVTMRCGRVEVKAEKTKNALLALQLRKLLNTSPVRNNEIALMTHNALPLPLQRLSSTHWKKMSASVISEIKSNMLPDFHSVIDKEFYKNIYKKNPLTVPYVFSESEEKRKAAWAEMVTSAHKNPRRKPEGIKYGYFGDVSVKSATPDGINQAQVYLFYENASGSSTGRTRSVAVARLQFVVTSKAGKALYENIAHMIDRLVDSDQYNGHCELLPVKAYKVFSEDHQVGRSDSAVIYLSAPLTDLRVQQLVECLDQEFGNRLAPIEVIGATLIGRSHLYGTTIPDRTLQKELTSFGTTSHGGIIRNILARAYRFAYRDMIDVDMEISNIDIDELTKSAQFYTKGFWNELGM